MKKTIVVLASAIVLAGVSMAAAQAIEPRQYKLECAQVTEGVLSGAMTVTSTLPGGKRLIKTVRCNTNNSEVDGEITIPPTATRVTIANVTRLKVTETQFRSMEAMAGAKLSARKVRVNGRASFELVSSSTYVLNQGGLSDVTVVSHVPLTKDQVILTIPYGQSDSRSGVM